MARSLQRMVRHGDDCMRRASGEGSSFCGHVSIATCIRSASPIPVPSLTATSILLCEPAVLRVKGRILMLLSSHSIQGQYSKPIARRSSVTLPNALKLSDGPWRGRTWNTKKRRPPWPVRWSALLGQGTALQGKRKYYGFAGSVLVGGTWKPCFARSLMDVTVSTPF